MFGAEQRFNRNFFLDKSLWTTIFPDKLLSQGFIRNFFRYNNLYMGSMRSLSGTCPAGPLAGRPAACSIVAPLVGVKCTEVRSGMPQTPLLGCIQQPPLHRPDAPAGVLAPSRYAPPEHEGTPG